MMKSMHILALLASSHCFTEALFLWRNKSKDGVAPHGMLPEWQITPVKELQFSNIVAASFVLPQEKDMSLYSL